MTKIKLMVVSVLAVLFLYGAVSANAHPADVCITFSETVGWSCVSIYDHRLEKYVLYCHPIRTRDTTCTTIQHTHTKESENDRDERALEELAGCLRGKVGEAIGSCFVDRDGSVELSESCMENSYPETWKYFDVLRSDLISSGEMTVADLQGLYGQVFIATGDIEIDMQAHIDEHPSDIDARNHELAVTIVHEKIHKHDVDPDGEINIGHDIVESDTTKVLEEIIGTNNNQDLSCNVDWKQQERVIYEA